MGCMLNLIGMLPLGQLGLRLIKWDAAPWLVSLPEAAEQVGCGFGGRLSKWDGGLGGLESVQLEGQVPPSSCTSSNTFTRSAPSSAHAEDGSDLLINWDGGGTICGVRCLGKASHSRRLSQLGCC